MILPQRRWAIRVSNKAGFQTRSREASLLIQLLIRASRNNPKGLPVAEQVLIAALRMFHDRTTVSEVAEKLAISASAAERALASLPKAAIEVAAENKMNSFVEVVNRILIP